jgi:hypothetical protein
MSERQTERLSSATGLVSAGLLLSAVAVGLWFPGWSADFDGSAQQWADFYTEERTSILVSVLLVSVGVGFLLWFIGHLNGLLRAAEGGAGRLAGISFGAGIFAAVAIHMVMMFLAVAAFRPEETPPEITRTVNDIAFVCGAPAAAGVSAMFAALAIATLRTSVLPAWLGWMAALTALLQLGPLGGLFTFTGPFNLMDGLLGIMLVVGSLGTWIALASAVMVKRAGETRGQPATP